MIYRNACCNGTFSAPNARVRITSATVLSVAGVSESISEYALLLFSSRCHPRPLSPSVETRVSWSRSFRSLGWRDAASRAHETRSDQTRSALQWRFPLFTWPSGRDRRSTDRFVSPDVSNTVAKRSVRLLPGVRRPMVVSNDPAPVYDAITDCFLIA